MIAPEVVVAEARSWIGTPWAHGQACKGVGGDCIGLIGGSATNVGLLEGEAFRNDQRYRGYGRTPNADLLLEACDKYMDRIDIKEVGVGDILVFRMAGQPHHFGIVSSLDPMYMVHAISNKKVAENRIDEKWSRRIMRAYRLRGVG